MYTHLLSFVHRFAHQKMQCSGHMRSFPGVVRSSRTSNHVVFAFCRPFTAATADSGAAGKTPGFWSKHSLDLRFKHADVKLDTSTFKFTHVGVNVRIRLDY